MSIVDSAASGSVASESMAGSIGVDASVVGPELAEAIAAAGLVVAAGPVGVGSAAEGIGLIEGVERAARLVAVARVDALVRIDESGVYLEHGHVNARTMFKHVARVSAGEAARLDKIARLCRGCPRIARAWRRGRLSLDQAAVLGRAWSNPRVRDAMRSRQHWFLKQTKLPFQAFERQVADWVRITDTDGANPGVDPNHVGRDVRLAQDHFSRQWHLSGGFGAMQGDQIRRVLGAYTDAEFLVDWERARVVHGDGVCRDVLARTDAQRRADALAQIFADAVSNPNRSVAMATEHVVVWSGVSLEEMIRRWAGAAPTPFDPDTHRCHSLAGSPLDENSAFADLMVSKFRRVVQDATSVCVDMSTSQRLFTGLARLGVQLSADTCYWPGCDLPVVACQADHLIPAARGGPTDQHNGGPACKHHNLVKERGYTVTRLPDGTIRVTTPSGETIPQ